MEDRARQFDRALSYLGLALACFGIALTLYYADLNERQRKEDADAARKERLFLSTWEAQNRLLLMEAANPTPKDGPFPKIDHSEGW